MTGCEKEDQAFTKRRTEIAKELFRKSIHMFSAVVPFLLHFAYWPVLVLLMLVVLVYSVSEIARINGKKIPLISNITTFAARSRDENRFVLGPVTLACGIILSALFWKEEYARIGIFALAFGDGSASLAGKLYGRVEVPFADGKTVAGSLTCFFAIFVSSFAVCGNAFAALILSLAGMLIEVLPLKDFDNLLIPVSIGGLATLLL
ncbi:MAG: phosphatidate cytidylyltransferase [Treponema sp.]|nr:phosphatidate cytidylyltransferase [Treponema sp.]MBR6192760.1 phosphatidate cytidylyltransferase [Treponema sp.]